ncbi:armadillo-type protein [Mrakia frigida]|uniref:COPI-interacting protein CEX1 n=1 Tax=Mrakia frigida TaxID=29902 RepID=UPI003FCC21C3
MEYFRSLGTSLLQQSGVVLPFALGERVTSFDREGTIWTLWDAVKRDDSTPISVFSFDASTPFAGRPDRRTFLPIAKNALKKIRSTRHPDILKFIDAHETESTIYIATERVKPLCSILSDATSVKLEEEYIMWGLQKITTALSFLNTQAVSVHGLVRPSSIFVTESGEWRLGGLDLLSSTRPTELETGVLWSMGGLVAGKEGVSPEVNKEGWSILKTLDPSSHDAYTLGLLIHKLFNPTHPAPPTSQPPHPPPQPSSRGAIPPSIFPQFKRMLNPNPKTRLTASGFLGEGGEPDSRRGYFAGNRFVWVGEGLEGWALRGEGERAELLKNIQSTTPPFPPAFLTHKVLPSLLHSLTLPSQTSSASALLPLVLRLGNLVPPQDYVKLVLDPVVKLYQSPDRGTRMALLEGLGEYEGKMDNKCVQERVWPHLITGFADTVPVIREATVKAIPLIAPKLSDRLLNNDLLRLLAKMQTDPEPSIRTNTCILLGRLAKNLGPNTKRKVLVPAFARSLKDSFVHARVAGLMAFMATVEVYEKEDLAGRVIPVCSGALVDGEKLVRDQAFIAVNLFVQRLEKLVASMVSLSSPLLLSLV